MNVVLENICIKDSEYLLESRFSNECVAEDFESTECICDLGLPLVSLYISSYVNDQAVERNLSNLLIGWD